MLTPEMLKRAQFLLGLVVALFLLTLYDVSGGISTSSVSLVVTMLNLSVTGILTTLLVRLRAKFPHKMHTVAAVLSGITFGLQVGLAIAMLFAYTRAG